MKATLTARILPILLVVLPQPLVPATITVDGQTDDPSHSVCDLVEAIEIANVNSNVIGPDCTVVGPLGDDTIELTVDVTLDTVDNLGNGDINPTGLPVVNSTIEIQGNGFTIRRDPEAAAFRIFLVGGDLTLRNTTVSGGEAALTGGAVFNMGTLTLDGSTLSGNVANTSGGAIANEGTVTLTSSTLSGNEANGSGGAIYSFGNGVVTVIDSTLSRNSAGGAGGAIYNSVTGITAITDSTLWGNSSIYSGGALDNVGTATITSSTLFGNSSETHGGALDNTGTATITNSTLSGNSAAGGAGIHNANTLTLENVTIAGNSAFGIQAAGVWNHGGGTATLSNSLLANGLGGDNCQGTMTDGGGNLADDGTCGMGFLTLSNFDPTLTDNGGPTLTHGLLPNSSAIGAAGSCATSTDQRGAGREGDCDSGAVEFLSCVALELFNDVVASARVEANCQKIETGPDFTVGGAGDLTLRAGRSIELGDGTVVESGGALTLELDGDLQIGKTVFVTGDSYNGNLGGRSICQGHATAALLTGTFKAWIGDLSRGPADHFTRVEVPYNRVDGVRVADDWSDLTDGTIDAPINLTETGSPATATYAWTSTTFDGLEDPTPGNSCEFFWDSASSEDVGLLGAIQRTDRFWTDRFTSAPCSVPYALYCFEQ